LTVIPSGMNTKLYASTNIKGRTRGLLDPKYVAIKILNRSLSRNEVITIGSRAKLMVAMSKIMPTRVNYRIFRLLTLKLK
jgi:short-subunit dehydrogenase